MILNFSKYSVWSGKIPVFDSKPIPKLSYFNGGSYFKIGFRWFRYLIEFSGPKKDTNSYIRTTSKQLSKELSALKKKTKKKSK
jgi:hypothetical protein